MTASGRPLDVLVLCNRPGGSANAGTIVDHLDAFVRYSRHRVRLLSFARQLPSALDMQRFDVLVIHYTIAIGWMSHHFIDAQARQRVRDFSGLKVVFIQDEYRHVSAAIEALRFMRIDVLFTCVPEGEIEKVYPAGALPGLEKVNNLTGYVPEGLVEMAVPPIARRPVDVGYRTRKLPLWLGELGREKWEIADRFAEHARGCGLRLDLSYREQDRLYGRDWLRFVTACKAMLGVESGASVFDFDGSLEQRAAAFVQQHPDADLPQMRRAFLAPYEGRIRLNQISPRCFESAALRTAMVMYEGAYSGVLQQGRHYIALRKDFGNFPEVVEALRDSIQLQRMVDCTYEEVARNPAYSYRTFIARFDEVVSREHASRMPDRAPGTVSALSFWGQVAASPAYVTQRALSAVLQNMVLGTRLRAPVFRLWERLPESAKNACRPFLRLMGR